MIRVWTTFCKSFKFLLVQDILKQKASDRFKVLVHLWVPRNLKHYSTTTRTVGPSIAVNMSTFKFLDYDCFGFDLDNTLLRYNVTNMVQLVYDILADYLVTERKYNPKYLLKPLEDKDLDFIQKGLFLDFEKGNILRINADGIIQRASHGTNLLSIEQIKEIYPEQKWEATDAFCNDMISTWNGPISLKLRSLLDYFDISSSLIFAKLIDTIDKEQGGPQSTYNVWPDILDGLIDMYNRDHFKLNKGRYFPSLKNDPDKYMYKCTEKTKTWLKELKKHRTTFLITGSNVDYANFTATYAFGEDWKSLFDIVIFYAKKPGFFIQNRPFLEIINLKEGNVVEVKDLKQNEMYSQGNWKGLVEFLGNISKKENPRCIYFGDNLVQDIYVPSSYVKCDTVVITEEQMSEGMVQQGSSHPDGKVLNSKFWGSYFCLKDSTTNVDSLWGHIIKKYSILCIPSIDIITQQPLEESYECFGENGKKYSGYYPALPLSLSAF